MRRALLTLLFAPLLAGAPPALAQRMEPVAFVQAALSRHPIVFLGDIHPVAEPKRLVVDLVTRQTPDASIDLLALEVASEQQEYIDRYLASAPEDTTILLDHPRTLRAHWGASRDYLAIYRAVYAWNRDHPDRPTRVLAADIRGWPVAPLTEGMAVGAFVNRDVWMAAALRKVLAAHPDWRVLVFMGGYHGLRTGGGAVRVGQARSRFDGWMAGYLAEAGFPMYTIMSDTRQDAGHGATRVFDLLAVAPGARPDNYIVALGEATDVVREPLHDVAADGYALEFWPSRFQLRSAVDAMLVLNVSTPTTPVQGPPPARTEDR